MMPSRTRSFAPSTRPYDGAVKAMPAAVVAAACLMKSLRSICFFIFPSEKKNYRMAGAGFHLAPVLLAVILARSLFELEGNPSAKSYPARATKTTEWGGAGDLPKDRVGDVGLRVTEV